jgi:hypothetical protein
MDLNALEKALQKIALQRNELAKIDYSNPKYDDLEEQLHDLEDALQDEYGDYLENVLQGVHDEYCPDSDVLHPVAYLAKTYQVEGLLFQVGNTEGVFVEMDDYPGKETKLVIAPGPLRVLLNIGKDKQEVVWKAN